MANLKLDKRSEDKLVNFINDVVIPLLEKNKTDSETIQKVNKIAFLFSCGRMSALSVYTQLIVLLTDGNYLSLLDLFDDTLKY